MNSEALDSSSNVKPIGQQIRELRKSRGVSLAALAARTGRSVGNLSEIERGKSEVNIQVLQKIAYALGVNMTWFFSGNAIAPVEERDIIVRKSRRRSLDFDKAGTLEEVLSPSLVGEILMVMTTFEPGSGTGDEPRTRTSEEAGLVISGRLDLTVDGHTFTLDPGDSFSLPANGSHFCFNSGDEKVVVLWAIAQSKY